MRIAGIDGVEDMRSVSTPEPVTVEELQEKYALAAQAEGGSPPWGGERQHRYEVARSEVDAVLEARRAHKILKNLGNYGIMSSAQEEDTETWLETNHAVLSYTRYTQSLMNEDIMWGFTEVQVADLEECAQAGLSIFELTEI
jgi:hypothetical protein